MLTVGRPIALYIQTLKGEVVWIGEARYGTEENLKFPVMDR